ncbi:MAG: glucans biosynthesis glucosyltransferase MdoH, partial [Caulobacteraceae bacterium]|nr:glucans biosynthesis glucosyltransferase MdoH [Caulobacteraceae bacterium]
RTAILLPAYNEDPGLILSAVEAIAEDLRRLDAGPHYDLFILSDTRDERIARDEAAGLLRLRHRLGARDGAPNVYYRRREMNVDRKAGNIADWVETHGGAYAYMLVLDADSLMSAETIVALSAAMDGDARLGLLQTVPTIVNAETPFARLQQFASRLYGPVFAVGQQWWSGAENNYYGHNAIIRVAAFAESAGLPHLTGPKPFGGHILSHDFIEAALLRRRGWAVRTAATLTGSYEETPPTLLDSALRDRRWCQGNLQHARLLNAAGLHWVSRLHLARGIFSYLAPMVWLTLLACGALVWPAQHVARGSRAFHEVIALFGLTLALLAAPKVMAFALALGSRTARTGFGGAGRLSLSLLIESVVSMLTAPVMMVMQSVAVVEVLIGRDSGWSPQNREGSGLSRRDAWRAHGRHVALGVLGGLGALLVSKYFLVWTSPVFLSLALSALLSLHTSRPKAGRALRRHGLFSIPEEEAPPPVLARALALREAYAQEAAARRRIAVLMREPVPAYEITCPAWTRDVRLVA